MARSRKSLAPETIELLLLSKSMLDRIRALAPVTPDRHPVALNVLLAHDAAELALAAVAHHCEKLPSGNRRYLMDYFAPLKTLHPKTDVRGQGYFDQLNRVRVNLKHKGIFPEPNQWMGVAERVYEYLSGWCSKYLHITLDELDRSVLLTDQAVKEHYDSAKRHFVQRKYKEVMEELAWTLHTVLETKPALSGISVGQSDAQDAIRLAAFGVQTNDFIRLQQFLPQVSPWPRPVKLVWNQEEYGHPGNWHQEAARFCLDTVLDIAVKLQNASWIPGPTHFYALYEYKVEALKDDVEIWNLPSDKEYDFALNGNVINRTLVKQLSKGETLRAAIVQAARKDHGLLGLREEKSPKKDEISLLSVDHTISGYIAKDEVKVSCVPRNTEIRQKYFPNLAEIEWWPKRE